MFSWAMRRSWCFASWGRWWPISAPSWPWRWWPRPSHRCRGHAAPAAAAQSAHRTTRPMGAGACTILCAIWRWAISMLPREREAVMWRYAQAAVQISQATQAQYLAGGAGALAALARFDIEQPHIDEARRWAAAHAGIAQSDALILADALATQHHRGAALRPAPRAHPAAGARPWRRPPPWRAAGRRPDAQRHRARLYGSRRDPARDPLYRARANQRAGARRSQARKAMPSTRSGTPMPLSAMPGAPSPDRARARERARAGDRYLESHALNTLGYAYVVAGEAYRAIPLIEQGSPARRPPGTGARAAMR